MRKIVVTFSGKAYDATTRRTVEQSPKLGADEVWVYDDKYLMESGYYETNRWLFEAKSQIQNNGVWYQHGFGWCSWKGFVLLDALSRISEGDIVLYLDADTFPIAPFGQLFDACAAERGVFLFDEGVSNARFTKADCMAVMGLPIADGAHACGRFSLWQKGPFLPRQMLTEWWAYSINPRCTLWDTSALVADPPAYYRNSTEQSVLSNLAIKYGIPLHRSPDGTPSGSQDLDLYGQVFEQVWCGGDRSDTSGSSYRNIATRKKRCGLLLSCLRNSGHEGSCNTTKGEYA